MNAYLQRLHELADGAIFDAQVDEVATCARAAGVKVQMKRIDLTTGQVHYWTIEPDGQPQTPAVRVYGKFPE